MIHQKMLKYSLPFVKTGFGYKSQSAGVNGEDGYGIIGKTSGAIEESTVSAYGNGQIKRTFTFYCLFLTVKGNQTGFN